MNCAICEKECIQNLSEICMPCILENYGEESTQWWRYYGGWRPGFDPRK